MNKIKRNWKVFLAIVFIVIIFYNVFSVLFAQKAKYLSHSYWQNFPNLEKAFNSSQYVSKHPAGWIPDEAAFSYAAGKLIKGTNPVLVVVDAPPLGKYLIGLSTLIFDNDSTVVAIFGIIAIIMLYCVSNQVLDNKLLALIPPLLYTSEPMFKNQFIYTPLLDIFQLVFLLSYFYFINKAFQKRKTQTTKIKLPPRKGFLIGIDYIRRNWKLEIGNFVLASLFLGCFISTKFFVSGTTLIAASLIWTAIHRNLRKAIILILTIPLSISILLLNYIRVFAFGYSFHAFLGIQKYIFLYHQSQIILPFSVWSLLLLNHWYVWFGDKPVISDSQWQITWPIITCLSFITAIMYLMRKRSNSPKQKLPQTKNTNIEILMIWSICYLIFLSSGQTFSRYLIILLPILYIISTYGVMQMISAITRKHKSKS